MISRLRLRAAGAALAGLVLLAATALTAGCGSPSSSAVPSRSAASAPVVTGPPDHVVVVVMENHGYDAIIGSGRMPWLNSLPAAVMTDWHAIRHPSEPNYLAMFTGSTWGVTDDHCPVDVPGPSLGGQLLAAGVSFTGYAENLPRAGYDGCGAPRYVRRHVPWAMSHDVPGSASQPFSAFPTDFSRLPRLAFVVPDQCDNMHSCPIGVGDSWLRTHLGPYVAWARSHRSLLVVTFDEAEGGDAGNRIPTLFVGPMVVAGPSSEHGDHYRLLRTLEAFWGLPGIGNAAGVQPLSSVFAAGTVPAA